jgi:hypothetical protein
MNKSTIYSANHLEKEQAVYRKPPKVGMF